MDHRILGRTGLQVNEIGLGTEYLINLPRDHVVSVIRTAIDKGINYFDVFFAQAAFRDNMGAAFSGYRDKVLLAAHLGSAYTDGQYAKTRNLSECAALFQDFMDRYDTGYADVLYLHNSDGQDDYDEIFKPGGLSDLAKDLKEQGKAKFIGFSGHTVETARQAVESGEVDVLMYPINMAGNTVPGRQELLESCARLNVGVVAMKIFGGGKLLAPANTSEFDQFQIGGDEKSIMRNTALKPVQGIHYALSQVGVSTVVPGCKDLDELEIDLAYARATKEERDYADILTDLKQFTEGECVYCNHCLPCPSEIDIGKTIRLTEMFSAGYTGAKDEYAAMTVGAENCVECGDCEERCPFGVPTVSRILEAADVFYE